MKETEKENSENKEENMKGKRECKRNDAKKIERQNKLKES
jgi:hypothetical protein